MGKRNNKQKHTKNTFVIFLLTITETQLKCTFSNEKIMFEIRNQEKCLLLFIYFWVHVSASVMPHSAIANVAYKIVYKTRKTQKERCIMIFTSDSGNIGES